MTMGPFTPDNVLEARRIAAEEEAERIRDRDERQTRAIEAMAPITSAELLTIQRACEITRRAGEHENADKLAALIGRLEAARGNEWHSR